jgi:malonyl-CoA/methylmalonyl-CoA synthetase
MTERRESTVKPSGLGWDVHVPAGAEPDLASRGTLLQVWLEHWADEPGRPAIWTPGSGWLTRSQVAELSARAARRLAGLGLRAGDRLLMSCRPSVELVLAYVGALRLGLTVVPANTAYTGRELEHIASDAQVSAAILDDPEASRDLRAHVPGLAVVAPDLASDEEASAPLDEVDASQVGLLCYTSGTTGRPKGAMLTHGNLLAGAEALRLAWRWGADDRLVLALPLFHVHGLCNGLHGTLLAGSAAVVLPRFEPPDVIDAAQAHDATMFFGVPTMYARLVHDPRAPELASLRLAVSGSAPLPPALFETIEATMRQRPLERYGMTETLMNASNPYEGERRPGTVGLPLPGVEVGFVEDTHEILVRGPNVFPGYWRNREATDAAFDGEGWFSTGDIGAVDDAGYLQIVARAKEVVITGGLNVYPREVEDVLLAHPSVGEAAVVGAPSEEWGETVVAFVVPTTGSIDEDELVRHCRAQLAAFKCPRRVWAMGALPLNAMGKVQRQTLVEEASRQGGWS